MSVVKVFVRWELWVNVPVAIFFLTEDYCGFDFTTVWDWLSSLIGNIVEGAGYEGRQTSER